MKKVKRRTPSGKINIHKKREKPALAKCANCKKPLQGVPKLVSSQMRKLAKTKRRPEKPYGGYLCTSCSRELFRERIRSMR